MNIFLLIIVASALTSLFSLTGALVLIFSSKRIKSLIIFLVSLSAGTLLGDAFLHLIPESVEALQNSLGLWLSVLGGIFLFFILEKIIHWRHCHISPSENHPHPVGLMNLVGDALHNFIDGMLIAGSFMLSPILGWATTIAVLSHEVPQELGDFGTLLHAGYKTKKALWLNLLSGLFSILGAVLVFALGSWSEDLLLYIIPFTAGGFIYIATSDLIPELKKDTSFSKNLKQLGGILLGLGLMLLIKFLAE